MKTVGTYSIKTDYLPEQEARLLVAPFQFDTSQPAILLESLRSEPLLKASVMIEGWKNRELSEVAIKDYSENAGIYDCLKNLGLVAPAHKSIQSGFVALMICRLQGDLLEAWLEEHARVMLHQA